ncbi:MAG: DoxX family protein [Ferruginibacter sp.]|nr:DoxX family protein [Cytophagales bacterium]
MILPFFSSKPTWPNGLAIVRVLVGVLIMKYGSVIFDRAQMVKEVDYFGSHLHLPAPLLMVYLAKGTEFFGGLLLASGLFTRGATLLLIINMTVATFFANRGAIFGDGERSFLYLLFFLVFFFAGAGKWSLDHWLSNRGKW